MKVFLKQIVSNMGYKITRKPKNPLLKDDPFEAIKSQQTSSKDLIYFDVGANQGQTIKKMLAAEPNATIYSFEPSRRSFRILKDNYGGHKNIFLFDHALGAHKGELHFKEYSWSSMDSFLDRAYGTTKITNTYPVEVKTVDSICEENKISHINLFKTDTEGYELNVLKGAESTIKRQRVQFILIEIFFNENYVGQPSFGDIYNYLIQNDFELIRFYDVIYTAEGRASKTDALFSCKNFNDH